MAVEVFVKKVTDYMKSTANWEVMGVDSIVILVDLARVMMLVIMPGMLQIGSVRWR